MAQVARSIDIDIDWLLEFLTREWRNVSCVASEWDTWDQESRLDFLSEWPITESYGEVLHNAVSRKSLTLDQASRYRQLLDLISESRPTIEDLLERG
jgi:hypothetical protein